MNYPTRRNEFSWLFLLGGLAIGALAMFVADPSQGRRRRAELQDKMNSATHKTTKLMDRLVRDVHNRLLGLQAQARRIMAPRSLKPIDDHVLEARVRSRLGREIPQFDQLQVSASQGTISLSGNITAGEEARLLEIVEAIPGVEAVHRNLEIHSAIDTSRQAQWSVVDTVSLVCAVSAGWWLWQRLLRDQSSKSLGEASTHASSSEGQLELPETHEQRRETQRAVEETVKDQGDMLH